MHNMQRIFNLTDSQYIHFKAMQTISDLPTIQLLINIRLEADKRQQRFIKLKSMLLK